MDMRKLINLLEDPSLKKEIIAVVKSTDDTSVLSKVLKILQAGNIEERIKSVLGADADASKFFNQIARTIIEIDAPVTEKDAFLKRIKSGTAIASSKLLDGKLHSFTDIVGSGFGLEVFSQLSVELVEQGVGPGEVALAVLSPDIQWSGRVKGGGDVIINKRPVEVKTRASKGGRWINARHAKLNVSGIGDAIKNGTDPAHAKAKLPDRIGLDAWVKQYRPNIIPKELQSVTKKMADSTFGHVDNTEYQQALATGDETAILRAILSVGYNNYKKYSGFEGMLLMDVPTQQVQYFKDFDAMVGNISSGTAYIYAPESEMMPQVILDPGATLRAGRFTIEPSKELAGETDDELETAAIKFAEKLAADRRITDPTMINTAATLIMQDLQDRVLPDNIVKRLYKQLPEFAKRPSAGAKKPAVKNIVPDDYEQPGDEDIPNPEGDPQQPEIVDSTVRAKRNQPVAEGLGRARRTQVDTNYIRRI